MVQSAEGVGAAEDSALRSGALQQGAPKGAFPPIMPQPGSLAPGVFGIPPPSVQVGVQVGVKVGVKVGVQVGIQVSVL